MPGSENDASYLVNLLLGFAIGQSEEFQMYKSGRLAAPSSSRADAKPAPEAARRIVSPASVIAPQLEKGVSA